MKRLSGTLSAESDYAHFFWHHSATFTFIPLTDIMTFDSRNFLFVSCIYKIRLKPVPHYEYFFKIPCGYLGWIFRFCQIWISIRISGGEANVRLPDINPPHLCRSPTSLQFSSYSRLSCFSWCIFEKDFKTFWRHIVCMLWKFESLIMMMRKAVDGDGLHWLAGSQVGLPMPRWVWLGTKTLLWQLVENHHDHHRKYFSHRHHQIHNLHPRYHLLYIRV